MLYLKYLPNFRVLQLGLPKSEIRNEQWFKVAHQAFQGQSCQPAHLGRAIAFNRPLALFMVGVFCKEAIAMTVDPFLAGLFNWGYKWGNSQTDQYRQLLAEAESHVFPPHEQYGVHHLPTVASAHRLGKALCAMAAQSAPRLDPDTVGEVFEAYTSLRLDHLVTEDYISRGEFAYTLTGELVDKRKPIRSVFGGTRLDPDKALKDIESEMKDFLLVLLRQPTVIARQGKKRQA